MHYLKTIILFSCIFFWFLLYAPKARASEIIFNEIHYDSVPKTDLAEFVELYNAGTEFVDLSGWAVDEGIEYLIPNGITLAPDSYLIIAQQPDKLRQKYALSGTVSILGAYRGQLSTQGDRLALHNAQGDKMDQLEYILGFPWPTVNVDAQNDPSREQSIGLIHPLLDNGHPGSWRSGQPTPGRRNSVSHDNPQPLVMDVQHYPQAPRSGDAVTVTVNIIPSLARSPLITNVTLSYQLVDPGYYIRLNDLNYDNWPKLVMNDDGMSGDETAGDGIYTTILPSQHQIHRRLIRYRIHAIDASGNAITVPYKDDPQPNYAYFVYDNIPAWEGAVNPSGSDSLRERISYDFTQMEAVPIYHFIARSDDINQALFATPRGDGYMGKEYKWRGTLIYDGTVYDHIGFRARGGDWRYAMGKNMWKINFARGHRFQAYDQDGRPYPTQWDKLNLSAIIQQAAFEHRGEQGLFEALSYRLFQLAGVPAPDTHYIHFRVIDDSAEVMPFQYEGDFWGLYLAVEQMDGRFLDANNLPDGNLYKMDVDIDDLNNQGSTGATDKSDLHQFLDTYENGRPDATWWEKNFDLAGYYSYRSIVEAIHHYDIHAQKNYYYYLNPETSKWSVLPWDVDLTWADNMYGTGREPFLEAILEREDFNFHLAYQLRLREIRDLLYNPEQTGLLIDEYANRVHTEGKPSLVGADRAMWDYNPIMTSSYVDLENNRAGAGLYYKKSPEGSFRGMAQLMKDYVINRSQWIEEQLLTDSTHPEKPRFIYMGPPNHPADQLTFLISPTVESETFPEMQWRVSTITNPADPDRSPPYQYEIVARWQSPVYTAVTSPIRLPNGSCPIRETCRVRVRIRDKEKGWSDWSQHFQFIAGEPSSPPMTDLYITEIMYHPPTKGQWETPWQEDNFEFIELANLGRTKLDLSGLTFTDGIHYTFPLGSELAPWSAVVLANNTQHFKERYRTELFSEYDGKLNNGGEKITLNDAFGREIYTVTYHDKQPWAEEADGDGYSLIPHFTSSTQNLSPNDPSYWRSSILIGGSPNTIRITPTPIPTNTPTSAPTNTPRPTATPQPTATFTPTSVPPDAYEPDDGCGLSATKLSTDGKTQERSFHMSGDTDWITFDTLGGTQYRVEIIVPHDSPADIKPMLYSDCNTPFTDQSWSGTFGPHARLTFTATTISTQTVPVYLKLSNEHSETYGADVSYRLSVRTMPTKTQSRAAIIMAGGVAENNPLQKNIYNVSNQVYQILRQNGYGDGDIYYLADEDTLDGHDMGLNLNNIGFAITQWDAIQNLANGSLLTLYIIADGNINELYFHNQNSEILTPEVLNESFKILEEKVSNIKINIILDAPQSSSFIEGNSNITRANRIVITSSSQGRKTHASENGLYFSDYFLTALRQGRDIYDSFSEARSSIQALFPLQIPVLEPHSIQGALTIEHDFIYSNTLANESWPPAIISAISTVNPDNENFTIRADVRYNDNDDGAIERVWAVVHSPSYMSSIAETNTFVPETLNVLELKNIDNNIYHADEPLQEVGIHRIMIHTKDSKGLFGRPKILELDVNPAIYLPIINNQTPHVPTPIFLPIITR